MRSGRPEVSRDLLAALRSGDATAVGALLSNDLQPAALSLRPQLRQTLEAGSEHGALASIVSGSGPTCAFLARGEEHALDLAASDRRGRRVPSGDPRQRARLRCNGQAAGRQPR